MMKRNLLLLSTILLTALGCQKDDPQPASAGIEGQWELTSVTLGTKSAVVGDETVSVYVEFSGDGSFSLYQQLGSGRFAHYGGSWTLSGETLCGKYSDGTSWACDYSVTVDNTTLVLSTLPDGKDSYTYRSCVIPDLRD